MSRNSLTPNEGGEHSPQEELTSAEIRALLTDAASVRLHALQEYIQKNQNEDYRESARKILREKIQLHNLTIDLIGVSHVPETAVAHSALLQSAIEQSDFVWLEGSRSFLDAQRKAARDTETVLGDRTSESHLSIDAHGFAAFFEYMSLIARAKGKDIFIADPADTDEARLRLQAEPVLLSAGALTAGLAVKDLAKQKVTRRTFLELGTAAVLTAGANRLGRTDFMVSDYRNIVLARAIQSVAEKVKGEKKMTVIYGASHIPAITKLLKDPQQLAQQFSKLSFVDTITAPPELRMYRYTTTPEKVNKLPDGRVDVSTIGHWKIVHEQTVE